MTSEPSAAAERPDVVLGRRLVRDEAEALGGVYDLLSRTVWSMARRAFPQAVAEDVVQDVFMQVWTRRHQFDESRGSLTSWVLRIARNRITDTIRAASARPQLYPYEIDLDARQEADGEPAPWEHAWLAERRQKLRQAIRGLIQPEQDVLWLAYFGYTQSEISKRLDVPLGTVKTRTRTALRKLRDRLGRSGPARLTHGLRRRSTISSAATRLTTSARPRPASSTRSWCVTPRCAAKPRPCAMRWIRSRLRRASKRPPPDLRARVMAVAEPPARRWRLPGWPALGFTAASTVGVAAVAAVIVLALRLGDLQQTVDDMQAGLSAQRAALVDIYATQPHTVTLHGMPGAEDAWAQLMFDDAGSQVMLVVDGLHAPRHDHVYHLWLIHESGTRVSGANFSTDLAGSAVVLVQSEHPVYVFHAFEVTEELMHVSPSSPTGDPMLAGTMPQ